MLSGKHFGATLYVFAAVLTATPAFAQMTVTGTVAGTVKDPTGDLVAGATVSLISENTGDTRNTTSNDLGVFNFIAVQPDTYTLKIEHAGFKAFHRTGLA